MKNLQLFAAVAIAAALTACNTPTEETAADELIEKVNDIEDMSGNLEELEEVLNNANVDELKDAVQDIMEDADVEQAVEAVKDVKEALKEVEGVEDLTNMLDNL